MQTQEVKALKILFVFDFDQTIVDSDTDTFIIQALAQNTFDWGEDEDSRDWNIIMQDLFLHLHTQGVSISRIQECLKTMDITNGYEKFFELMKSKRNFIDSVILSDSNQFFIDTLLEHWGIKDLFQHVITNPCQLNHESQQVIISPYHQHDCATSTCPKNLCKRSALTQHFKNEMQNLYDRIYYFGDGKNDYCPLKLLRQQDVAFARKGYPLDKLIHTQPVPCQVFRWEDGHQIVNSQHFKDLADL